MTKKIIKDYGYSDYEGHTPPVVPMTFGELRDQLYQLSDKQLAWSLSLTEGAEGYSAEVRLTEVIGRLSSNDDGTADGKNRHGKETASAYVECPSLVFTTEGCRKEKDNWYAKKGYWTTAGYDYTCLDLLKILNGEPTIWPPNARHTLGDEFLNYYVLIEFCPRQGFGLGDERTVNEHYYADLRQIAAEHPTLGDECTGDPNLLLPTLHFDFSDKRKIKYYKKNSKSKQKAKPRLRGGVLPKEDK